MKAESLYKITLFIPVFIGILFTRTPWWSAIVSVSVGVVAALAVGVAAARQSELPIGFMNILFADIKVNWLGFDLTRYELNAIVGIFVTGGDFLGSTFFNKREGAFKQSIESFEQDLKTPAQAEPDTKISADGLKAYRLMAKLAILIGIILIPFTFLSWDRNGWLNALAGLLAIAVGVAITKAISRYEQSLHRSIEPKQD